VIAIRIDLVEHRGGRVAKALQARAGGTELGRCASLGASLDHRVDRGAQVPLLRGLLPQRCDLVGGDP
jgi:hypothetical protein